MGEQRRRSTRIDQALPVIVRGVDLLGQPFEERTATQSLSFHGCRYSSKHHLPKNTWITLEVPSGHRQKEPRCVRARVTWIQRPRTLRELFQVAVELEAGSNIWGVPLPPEDWISSIIEGMDRASVNSIVETHTTATEKEMRGSGVVPHEGSLDSYLEEMFARSSGQSLRGEVERAQDLNVEDSPLLQGLRREFETQTQKVLEEARAAAEQLIEERTSKLHNDLRDKLIREHQATAETFHEKWRQEFEGREADAKEQITSELTQHVAEQVARSHEEVHQSLKTEWGDNIEREQASLAEWNRRAEMLREETRAASEAAARESERRLDEKLSQQLNELREEFAARAAIRTAPDQPSAEETQGMRDSAREGLQAEMDVAREQWSELLETSLDSAAQRLAGRLTAGSQEILQAAEQKLAARAAELQEDSGLSAEAAQAALDEVKVALEQEVSRAKRSLAEIEHAATQFSEYSRQLDAASQDSVNELRQRLESSVALQVQEFDRRAAELQKESIERASSQLAEMSGRTAAQTVAEVAAKMAPILERVAETTRQLSAREQEAKEILHIHRERLRQASEQAQREAAQHMSAALASLRENFELARKDASAQWAAEIDADAARTAEKASAALEKACENQWQEGVSRLDASVEESVHRATASMEATAAGTAEAFRAGIEKIEAAELHAAGEDLDVLVKKRLEFARHQLEATAEEVAGTFGQVVQAAAEDATQHVVAQSNAHVEQERARLAEAGEQVLHRLQAQAQNSFNHFQEQLSIHTEQHRAQSSEGLTSQLGATLDLFREQGRAQLAEWCAKQEGLEGEAFERHEDRLRSAGNSWLDATMRQLDAVNQNRMDSLIQGAEDAMRRACVDVFDGLAQAMKEKLLGAFNDSREAREAAPPAGAESKRERHTSA
ncbi:MAG: coiled-coil domain-containing protein [Candidatus Acidiferrales bacterium]